MSDDKVLHLIQFFCHHLCTIVIIIITLQNHFLCRGALKYHIKLYSGAIDDLNTAISLDPTHTAFTFFNSALCHQATGKLNKVCVHV